MDKQQRLARQNELYHVQQRQIARIETAIKRYAIWAKTYDSEKFAKRAKAIQNRLDHMDKLDRPMMERRRMELKLHGWRGSQKVLEFKHVSKSFGQRKVLAACQPDAASRRAGGSDRTERHGQERAAAPGTGNADAGHGGCDHRSERDQRLLRPGARDARSGADGAGYGAPGRQHEREQRGGAVGKVPV